MAYARTKEVSLSFDGLIFIAMDCCGLNARTIISIFVGIFQRPSLIFYSLLTLWRIFHVDSISRPCLCSFDIFIINHCPEVKKSQW
ncbi:MAG: hypothetical protein IGQ45_14065 [Cyanobacterium sp. T60_A2020_053]|nr:hypothetical protein [Cyanobacterium sp. T60_A2020_053]